MRLVTRSGFEAAGARRRRCRIAGLGVTLLGLAAAAVFLLSSPRERASGERVEPVACDRAIAREDVSCVRFRPGGALGGDPVSLPIVRIGSESAPPDRAPLVVLTGGPGVGVVEPEEIERWAAKREGLRLGAEVVLYDRRGVGRAAPALRCQELGATLVELFSRPEPRRELEEEWLAAIERCAEAHAARGVDLSELSTEEHVRDLEALVDALGYERVRLYGVSYGTRLAAQAARAMPERIEAMILDGAFPPRFDAAEWDARLYGHAVERLDAACRARPSCARRVSDVEGAVEDLYARWTDEPIAIDARVGREDGSPRFPVPGGDSADRGAGTRRFSITGDDFLELLLMEMRWSPGAAIDLVAGAKAGREDALRSAVEVYVDFFLSDPRYHYPAGIAVDCSDILPAQERDVKASGLEWLDSAWEGIFDRDFCDPVGLAGATAAWQEPVETDIPTLFLAGAFDPVTPPKWARAAAEGFSSGHVVVFPDRGHDLHIDDCPIDLAGEFLAEPEAAPAAACAEAAAGGGLTLP